MRNRDYTPKLTGFALELRRRTTVAEHRLWQHLRANRLDGWHFRRQHPIAGYILDFYCDMLRLAIEIDGSQHLRAAGRAADERRNAELEQLGVKVVRFTNHQTLSDTAATAQLALWACRKRAAELGVEARSGIRREDVGAWENPE